MHSRKTRPFNSTDNRLDVNNIPLCHVEKLKRVKPNLSMEKYEIIVTIAILK